MSAKRQAAFKELKQEVDHYRAELGNIHGIMEDYQKKVEKFPDDHKIHDEVSKLETLSGLILASTVGIDNLLKTIKTGLDDKPATEQRVKKLYDLIESGIEILAGLEVLEKDINDFLSK